MGHACPGEERGAKEKGGRKRGKEAGDREGWKGEGRHRGKREGTGGGDRTYLEEILPKTSFKFWLGAHADVAALEHARDAVETAAGEEAPG